MSAYLYREPDGDLYSISTSLVSVPAGWTVVTITDQQYADLSAGLLRWDNASGTLVATNKLQEETNQQTLTDQAAGALDANATFLAISSPTNAQNAAQVKALTRQVNGLIRFALNRFESTT